MAKIQLAEMALPKTGSGRPGRTPDADLYEAIRKILAENPTIKEDGEDRPRVVGLPTRLFDTEGKAVSDGRVYRDALMKDETLNGRTVRVRAIKGEQVDGKDQFGWGVYIPLKEPESKTEEAAAS